MQVKIKKLHPEAIIPTYATPGAACFDLYALSLMATYHIHQYSPEVITTGLAFEIPQDHVMLVFSRSGHGFNHGVRLANCVGVIDSDYRGEVKVKLTADTPDCGLHIKHGDRIAQAMIIPVEQAQFIVVDELSSTKRGTGGMGSTGK